MPVYDVEMDWQEITMAIIEAARLKAKVSQDEWDQPSVAISIKLRTPNPHPPMELTAQVNIRTPD